MDCCCMRIASFTISPTSSSSSSSTSLNLNKRVRFGYLKNPISAVSQNGSASNRAESTSARNVHRQSRFETLFCYDKNIPEERIEEPIGIAMAEKEIGDNPRCSDCEAKGAVLCATCTGTGLYVDSIMESQGIIVKVRCLGCGGTGNIMCRECGGRGHLGGM